MYKELRKMANFYFLRIASIAAFASIVLIVFASMLLNRIRKVFCSKKKRMAQASKKRAGNGMVVGEKELDDIKQTVKGANPDYGALQEQDSGKKSDKVRS
jgi:hypothetical protein